MNPVEIELLLPKRRARASRFWKPGYLSLELYLFHPRSRPFLPIPNPLVVVDSPNTAISHFNPLAMKAAKDEFLGT